MMLVYLARCFGDRWRLDDPSGPDGRQPGEDAPPPCSEGRAPRSRSRLVGKDRGLRYDSSVSRDKHRRAHNPVRHGRSGRVAVDTRPRIAP